jgi:hypothetical protein
MDVLRKLMWPSKGWLLHFWYRNEKKIEMPVHG